MVQKIKELITGLFKGKPKTDLDTLRDKINLQLSLEKSQLAKLEKLLMLSSHQLTKKAKLKSSISAYKNVLTMIKEGDASAQSYATYKRRAIC